MFSCCVDKIPCVTDNILSQAMELTLEAGDDVCKATVVGDLFQRSPSPLWKYVMWLLGE